MVLLDIETVPVPFCPHEVPHALDWVQTQASVIGGHCLRT